MGSDVEQIFQNRTNIGDHSILFALLCEKECYHMGKNSGNPELVCKNFGFDVFLCFVLIPI